MKRRGLIGVIGEILSVTTEGVSRTAIAYRANLNFSRAKKYISMLLKEGLLSRGEGSSAHLYKITDKGKNFLKAYKKLKRCTFSPALS